MTEGNMVVMLMDIQLTPNSQLGRRIYNFSATVYEVAEGYSLDTLKDLGIINIQDDFTNRNEDEEKNESNVSYTVLSQLPSVIGTGQGLVSDYNDLIRHSSENSNPDFSLQTQYDLIYGSGIFSSMKLTDNPFTLKNLKIQFESEPQ
jgi:hypothetical protein